MSKNKKLIAAMTVLEKYYDTDDYHLWVDFAINLFETDRPLSQDDVQTMIDCGFKQEFTTDGRSEIFTASDYDPEEAWRAYI